MFRSNQIVALVRAAAAYPKPHFRSFSRRAKDPSRQLGNDGNKTYERKLLPAELSTHTAMLTCKSSAKGGVCHVYLVGTNHDSKQSGEQVQAVIKFLKPEAVFLEMCNQRRSKLEKPIEEFGGSYCGEFRVASDEAMKYGARVYLGDRDSNVDNNPNSIWNIPIRIIPHHDETIVHERDQYMSATLLQVARQHNSVVAVVGRGHLQGMQKHWEQPVDMQPLLSIPSKKKRKPVGEILIYIGATVGGVAMAFIHHQ